MVCTHENSTSGQITSPTTSELSSTYLNSLLIMYFHNQTKSRCRFKVSLIETLTCFYLMRDHDSWRPYLIIISTFEIQYKQENEKNCKKVATLCRRVAVEALLRACYEFKNVRYIPGSPPIKLPLCPAASFIILVSVPVNETG